MVATPSAEVKLLKDDNWKLIQQNTFTRWVNQHLKKQADIGGPQIDDLENDLADGISLIKLAEVLSGKPLSRYNKTPTMRTQKLDNVSLVLNFFQNKEGIKIVNIDSSHIVDRNLKLILGLVWTLILHYSLSHRHFNLEHENGADRAEELEKKETTPKKRLLVWVQSKLPQNSIKNFTSNWNDGIALGALVDACLGGRFGEWKNWESSNGLENTQKAMQAAEQALGVETLITAEELTNPNVDEKSVMTYLAQFPRAKPKMLDQIGGYMDHHPFVGIPTKFTIELDEQNYHPELSILDPHGQKVGKKMSTVVPNRKYQVEFIPKLVGEYKINLLAKSHEAASQIPIESTTIQAILCPQIHGLHQIIHSVGMHHRFQIKNVSDYHQLDVRAIDSNGKEILLDSNSERDEESIICCYTPKMIGKHQIDIRYNGRNIPGSPFEFEVINEEEEEGIVENTTNQLKINPLLAYKGAIIWGRGILPKGTGATEKMIVNVDNCSEPVKIAVVKENKLIPYSIQQNTYLPFGALHPRQSFVYIPQTSGIYEVTVMTENGDLLLGKSPYKVIVGPKNLSAIRATGPGLEEGIAGEESIFYVDTCGETDQLEFAIEGPSETQIYCTDGGNGTAIVKYTPLNPGCYTIKILELDTNKFIKDSPFVIWVDSSANSHSHQMERNKSGGGGKFNNEAIPVNFDGQSSFLAGNVPHMANPNSIKLLHRHPELANHEVPKFTPNHQKLQSFNSDAKMIELSGRGLETFVPGQKAEFVVDTSNAGLNTLFVAVITSNGPTEELNIRHIGGDEYLVNYLVPFNMQAQIHIKYGESNVPGSPFFVNPSSQIQQNNGNGKEHYFSI